MVVVLLRCVVVRLFCWCALVLLLCRCFLLCNVGVAVCCYCFGLLVLLYWFVVVVALVCCCLFGVSFACLFV